MAQQYPFYAMLSRMRYIERWGLMHNTFRENIQEHSHMVAVLAHALALIDRQEFGASADPERCACAALYHDCSEILTGDLPTPIKYDNPAIRDAYKAVEKVAADRLLSMLPSQLEPYYRDYLRECDQDSLPYVKAADKLAAYLKCVEELQAGNAEFASAAASTRAALESLHFAPVDWFLLHCTAPFRQDLDELNRK